MKAEQRVRYLEAMGIVSWRERGGNETRDPESGTRDDVVLAAHPSTVASVAERPPQHTAESASPESRMGWDELAAFVRDCTKCGLRAGCTQTVFGVGDRKAQWMVIGEGPGADEDRLGEPFVGRAGQLLNSMLNAVGLAREQVYIANIVKCRPPNNRDPLPEEAASCEPYLLRQIELVNPRIILAVGRIAAQNLLKTDTPIGRLRGVVHRLGPRAIPVVVTYHPAYLLRSPQEKRKVWQDLCLARGTLAHALAAL